MEGRISSFESMGTLDGPGVRFVAFLQGCPLRCVYCHNPETWAANDGFSIDSADLVKRAQRYVPYFGSTGGLTLSGGEPLCQSEFVEDILKRCRSLGIHTALDTAGGMADDHALRTALEADLILLDIKFTDEKNYQRYTGGSLGHVIGFLDGLSRAGKAVWIRHVVIPGINDSRGDIARLWALLRGYPVIQRVELLPFRKLCIPKYEKLKIPFPLKDTPQASPELMKELGDELALLSDGKFKE